jgi:SNF2 family DNA or RNA helicase
MVRMATGTPRFPQQRALGLDAQGDPRQRQSRSKLLRRTMTIKPMAHQAQSLKFMADKPAVLDFSDCGTGKTLVEIVDFAKRHKVNSKAMLVLCPKSIMRAAWEQDIKKFAPHLVVSLCPAKDRLLCLQRKADVYIVNIDGAIDLLKLPPLFWKKFETLVIDEANSIKHRTSNRSKAVAAIAKHFKYKRLLTGTPAANGICDLWHLAFVADGGQRLGKSFFSFRAACCVPVQTGPMANMITWIDREGIELAVAALLADITIRHRFEDCVDIPENHCYAMSHQLGSINRKIYDKLEADKYAEIRQTGITAVNGAALATKLLQTASGAVYNDNGGYSLATTDRYALVLDLVEARRHSIVFYQWDHQCEELVKEAVKRKLTYAIWHSSQSQLEQEFQAGKYQVMFAHPQSAGHGLTLTKATATIWASPTYNLDHFTQGSKRIYRIGQTQKTETIVVVAENTFDERAWTALANKRVRMHELFDAVQNAA